MNSKNKDIDNKKTLSQMADELIGDFRQLDTCTEEEITSSWQSVVSRTRHKRNLTYWYSGIAACLLIEFTPASLPGHANTWKHLLAE